jgi:long-subunit acyl-CoA synthetase (AMP-forming)
LTETATVVCASSPLDIWFGSSGNIVPGVEARILTPEGEEIHEYDTPGELVLRSPSVVLGYLNNEKATKETFKDGWMYTGDEAMLRVGPKNTEHVWIVDRIKELIKVKVCLKPKKFPTKLTLTNGVFFRVYKLRQLSSRRIYSNIPWWPTAR